MGKGRKKRRPAGPSKFPHPRNYGAPLRDPLRAEAIARLTAQLVGDLEHGPVTAENMADLVTRRLLSAADAKQYLRAYGGTDAIYKVDPAREPSVIVVKFD